MLTRPIETRTMKISEVKSHFSSLVNEIYRTWTRIIAETSSIPVAALVHVMRWADATGSVQP